MNEVNAILTTEEGHVRSSRLLAGREAGGQQATGVSSPPPLAGRRCPSCGTEMELRPDGYLCVHIACCYLGTSVRPTPRAATASDSF